MSGNPFLLPPGGPERENQPAATPAARPAPRREAEQAPAPDHYIAVPASVESATHRLARPEPSPADSGPAEETQVAAPRRWVLLLPDGTRMSLEGPLLLGRDPAGIADRPDARLMPVDDGGKTVSKAHALLEPGSDGVQVRELHSTNGVAIDTLAGRRLLSEGGEGIAPLGATIMLGSFPIVVATG